MYLPKTKKWEYTINSRVSEAFEAKQTEEARLAGLSSWIWAMCITVSSIRRWLSSQKTVVVERQVSGLPVAKVETVLEATLASVVAEVAA